MRYLRISNFEKITSAEFIKVFDGPMLGTNFLLCFPASLSISDLHLPVCIYIFSMALAILVLSVVCASVHGARCNPESIMADITDANQQSGLKTSAGNLHFLPQVGLMIHTSKSSKPLEFILTLSPYNSHKDKGDESPACLDGSPYGFYFSPSQKGSTKWTISINGGGWFVQFT